MINVPPCFSCANYIGGSTCLAFDGPIPRSILLDGNNHDTAVKGDNGIMFEPEKGSKDYSGDLKHLPGDHDQQSHGKHSSSGYKKPQYTADGKIVPGSVGGFAGVQTSQFKKGAAAQAALKKIAVLEKAAAEGDWTTFTKNMSGAKWEGANARTKAILKAQNNLLKLKDKNLNNLPGSAKPSADDPAIASDKGWKKVGGKLGTEKGGVYEMGGKKYYVKIPDDPNRAKNEALATKLYETVGAGVVKGHLVEIDGKTAFASEWMNSDKVDWDSAWDGEQMKNTAAEDFAVHAWLNNRDAIGAGTENPMDNIRLDHETLGLKLVDAGGSLNYKGMGGSGKKDFKVSAPEWDTLRDPSINPTMAKVFGGMTTEQLVKSASKLKNISNDQIDSLVDKYGAGTDSEKTSMKAILKARRDTIIAKSIKLGMENGMDMTAATAAFMNKKNTETKVPAAKPVSPDLHSSYWKSKKSKINKALDAGKDVDDIISPPTSNSSQQHKDLWAYTNQLKAYHKGGGDPKAVAAGKPQPAPKPFKVKVLDLPDKPTFHSSNAAQVEANNKTVTLMKAKAAQGDIDGVNAMAKDHPSPKVKAYGDQLVDNVKQQRHLHDNPPEVFKAANIKSLADKVGTAKGKTGLQKIGRYDVLGKSETTGLKQGVNMTTTQRKELQSAGLAAYEKSTGAKVALKQYTGYGYAGMNKALMTGDTTSADGVRAVKASEAILKHGVNIPVGTTLHRGYNTHQKDLLDYSEGQVISQKTLLSTADTPSSSFSGNVKMRITAGEGLLGMPMKHNSKFKNENEVILAPNQRFVINKISKQPNTGQTILEVYALPTEQNQCCPP